MKKLLAAALLSALVASNASAWIFGGGCNGCKRARSCNVETTCEAKPVCYKMVRKECPARKVCETNCHWVCPPDTIREDGEGANGY
jgi:hypothetical protein